MEGLADSTRDEAMMIRHQGRSQARYAADEIHVDGRLQGVIVKCSAVDTLHCTLATSPVDGASAHIANRDRGRVLRCRRGGTGDATDLLGDMAR